MKTIVSVNEKGGVCKTTSLVILARGLASRGKRVLVVDLDPQRGNISRTLGGDCENLMGTYELLMDEEATVSDCIQNLSEGIDLVAASSNVEAFATKFDRVGKEQILKERLSQLDSSKYDYVLIDTPPKILALAAAAITACDCALVPTTPTKASIEGVSAAYRTFSAIKKYYNPNAEMLGIVLMMVDSRTTNVQQAAIDLVGALGERLSLPLFEAVVPRSKLIQESVDYNEDWTAVSAEGSRNKAIAKCWEFVDEFERRIDGMPMSITGREK